MTLVTLEWDDAAGVDGRGALRLLDQTLLPGRTEYRVVDTTAALVAAIRELAVRGAPALGVAGAMGVVLALDEGAREGWDDAGVRAAVDRVRAARPTAVNLAWGVDRVRPLVERGRDAVLAAARELAAEDEAANRELSRHAADWLLERVDRPRLRVLTHCNAGTLATAGWGTALGVVRELRDRGRLEFVYADETRPLLQGARLTAYELAEEGIPPRGAGRRRRGVDGPARARRLRRRRRRPGGRQRRRREQGGNRRGGPRLPRRRHPLPRRRTVVHRGPGHRRTARPSRSSSATATRWSSWGVHAIAPAVTPGFNPAFDVTPARLVDAVATEHGVVQPRAGTRPPTPRACPVSGFIPPE